MQLNFIFGLKPLKRPEPEGLKVSGRILPLRFVRHRRARRYVLRLGRDGSAQVTLPRGGSIREAKSFVQRHLGWLEKQLLRQSLAMPKPWRAGTEILFRGESVRIVVEGLSRLVRFGPESLSVEQADDLRPAIERHLRQLAERELPARTQELARAHGLAVKRVTVRNQRSRWGSCSTKGVISLNWRLVQAPLFVRDYIILHELAHLKEMNHSRRFWLEVERLCPDFARAETWLRQHSGMLR